MKTGHGLSPNVPHLKHIILTLSCLCKLVVCACTITTHYSNMWKSCYYPTCRGLLIYDPCGTSINLGLGINIHSFGIEQVTTYSQCQLAGGTGTKSCTGLSKGNPPTSDGTLGARISLKDPSGLVGPLTGKGPQMPPEDTPAHTKLMTQSNLTPYVAMQQHSLCCIPWGSFDC